MVSGAGEEAPGVNLKARNPQPSTVCPVEEYGVLQSLLMSVGWARQKEPEEHVGVRSRFEKPYMPCSESRNAATEKLAKISLIVRPIIPGCPAGGESARF